MSQTLHCNLIEEQKVMSNVGNACVFTKGAFFWPLSQVFFLLAMKKCNEKKIKKIRERVNSESPKFREQHFAS
jgi:hypothetical protein